MSTTSKSPGRRKEAGKRGPRATRVSSNGDVGEVLRKLRLSRELSLADVAKGTSISASFLSMVENGRSDITIGRLIRLMQFYGVSLADLLPVAQGSDPDIVHEHERRRLHSPAEGMDIFMLGPQTERGMMPMLLAFEPGAGRKDYGRHAGQEFLFVLEGELILELEGSEPRRLKAGDAACYPGDRPHLLRNGSTRKALRLICVDSTRVL
jgi:transcriptional regulator with XRE-family HTH domain